MSSAWTTLSIVVAGAVVGLMGTDLVLPAVPVLPEAMNGTARMAQMVLAAYVAGTCVGLLGFGALGSRVRTSRLLLGSLVATALLSFACTLASSLESLVALRAAQGAAAAGPAVFAPAIVKAMLDEARAMRAMGLIGSIESLAPALAPIAGAALLASGSWRTSFSVLALVAAALALLLLVLGRVPEVSRSTHGTYAGLLADAVFMRYATSQALVLGGLLTFVFGMPAIFVRVFGGTVTDFIVMQATGIMTFIAAANLASRAVARFGAEEMIGFGTRLVAVGTAGQFGYALAGGESTLVITALAVPMNVGLGLRGPPGFYRAIVASRGDDARGAALVVLGILAAAAAGTAIASPWIESGTVRLTAIALAMHVAAVISLARLPRLREEAAGS